VVTTINDELVLHVNTALRGDSALSRISYQVVATILKIESSISGSTRGNRAWRPRSTSGHDIYYTLLVPSSPEATGLSSLRGACGARANAPMVHQTPIYRRASASISVHQRASVQVRHERAPSVHQTCTNEHATMREFVRQRHASPCRAVAPTLRVTCYASPARLQIRPLHARARPIRP
jgi:hypothetical protein